jgi:hypothetical protein
MSVAFSNNFSRGSNLLLAQCRLLGEWEQDLPVRARLERRIGGDLARKLLYALVRPV